MKRLIKTWCIIAIFYSLLLGLGNESSAQPSTSPSALSAAKLKHRPPQNWIRHYLGDDRYKIAGGVWKVVSTELDRYYYPAWAPEMLRQKPGIVIGFASAAEAEEAGYMPSGYPMNQSLYGLTASEILAAKQQGRNSTLQRGTLILLADGRSTVILPKGWRHIQGEGSIGDKKNAYGKLDVLTPSDDFDGRIGISFEFNYLPPGIDAETYLSAQAIENARSILQTNSRSVEGLAEAKMGQTTLGGLRGVTFIPGQSEKWPAGISGRMTIVGRGNKLYSMAARLPANDKNYSTVVNSFRPR